MLTWASGWVAFWQLVRDGVVSWALATPDCELAEVVLKLVSEFSAAGPERCWNSHLEELYLHTP